MWSTAMDTKVVVLSLARSLDSTLLTIQEKNKGREGSASLNLLIHNII
jgi:hypothetical protein